MTYSSGTNPTDYTYTGQYSYTDDFGLMYYGARWYDSSLGRFTQPDSIIPPSQGIQKWDHYAYVNNNPLIYTDPSGHVIESIWDAASLVIGVGSLAYNLSQGNYVDAAIDTVGIVIDAAALAIPVVPGGASAIIKAYRAGDAALEIAETAVKYGDEVVEAAVDYGDEIVGAICSFSEDTKVTTREGEKEIADIEEGDYVLAWNEATNEIGYYEVTDTFSHIDPVLTELIINGEWIETTPEHPFYTLEEGWLPADELESGMHVRQADGDYELVWFKWNIEKDQEMYNFTVDIAHTYFVGDGQWLVHNACNPKDILFTQTTISKPKYYSLLEHMSKNGWDNIIPAIDVVITPAGLSSVDNKRLAVAKCLKHE